MSAGGTPAVATAEQVAAIVERVRAIVASRPLSAGHAQDVTGSAVEIRPGHPMSGCVRVVATFPLSLVGEVAAEETHSAMRGATGLRAHWIHERRRVTSFWQVTSA